MNQCSQRMVSKAMRRGQVSQGGQDKLPRGPPKASADRSTPVGTPMVPSGDDEVDLPGQRQLKPRRWRRGARGTYSCPHGVSPAQSCFESNVLSHGNISSLPAPSRDGAQPGFKVG